MNRLFQHQKTKDFLEFISVITLSLFIITFVLRMIELIQMVWVKPLFDNSLSAELIGVLSDLGAFSQIAFLLFGISLLFCWNKYAYKTVLYTLSISYIIINLSTVFFFLTALVPMDQSMFTFSFEEILVVIKSTEIGITGILFIIFPFIIFFICLNQLKKTSKITLITPVLFIIGAFLIKPYTNYLTKEEQNILKRHFTLNKADFFIYKSLHHFTNPTIESFTIDNTEFKKFIDFRQEDNFYQKASQKNNDFFKNEDINEYPLLHENNFDPLSDYFKKLKKKPNVVFVIIESFGGRFFNPKKDPICFAPYLDSLKNKSLYWKNCFSTAERTFSVLPSTLGSLPYGAKGFSEIDFLPEHLSITSLLKSNDYYGSFFYGGWTGFHGMERLLKKQNIDYMTQHYPAKYKDKLMKKDANGFSWGYPDGEMINRSFEVMDSLQKKPMLNIYLTLSTHSPFSIPNKPQHIETIKNLLAKNKKSDQLDDILKNSDPYVSVIYADKCVKKLINTYKEKGLYDNTIFVITGDHFMHELGAENALEIYNVPLIIHSPLLKKHENFDAIVSHHDVTPSLINLLKNHKLINTPTIFDWMGYGLETNNKINNKFIPLMQNNKEIVSCIYRDYFYINNELYRFKTGQYIHPSKDEGMKKKIAERLENFKKVNYNICSNDLITPLEHIFFNQELKEICKYSSPEFETEKSVDKKINTIELTKNYKKVFFDFSLKMSYQDTLQNPNIMINILNEKNEKIDYFMFKNDKYVSLHDKVNKYLEFHITRTIDNNGKLFNKKNKLVFIIQDVRKEIKMEKFKIKIQGIE